MGELHGSSGAGVPAAAAPVRAHALPGPPGHRLPRPVPHQLGPILQAPDQDQVPVLVPSARGRH
eukprot:1001675-Pyramimonas_sp.AAC.2